MAGSRSLRFDQLSHRVYVVKEYSHIFELAKIKFWNTHPDFDQGFDIWEISTDFEIFKDEKFHFGYFLKKPVNAKLKETIMKYKVIVPFSILCNSGTLTEFKPGKTVTFSADDIVSYTVQSGSLGDLYSFFNHTTNQAASKMILTYSNPFKDNLQEI